VNRSTTKFLFLCYDEAAIETLNKLYPGCLGRTRGCGFYPQNNETCEEYKKNFHQKTQALKMQSGLGKSLEGDPRD